MQIIFTVASYSKTHCHQDISLDKILQTEDEGDIGFLVEVELDYPGELHDKHADYPLVPDKEPIDLLELRDFELL